MRLLGIQLRSPGFRDLPVMLFAICVGIALTWAEMRFLGWPITQANSALFGAAGFGVAAACGVDMLRQGIRGFLVAMIFVMALVGTSLVLLTITH
jgi:phosphate/sulfate permease